MLLRYLKPITLKRAEKEKQRNGTYKNSYIVISDYRVQIQQLTDDVISASIYGANLSKMLRISTPLNNLEKYLLPKVENKEDNISNYYIFIGNKTYKVVAVAEDRIDIELVNSKSSGDVTSNFITKDGNVIICKDEKVFNVIEEEIVKEFYTSNNESLLDKNDKKIMVKVS